MSEDHEVTREIWDGKIPVEFVVAEDEMMSVEQLKPYYVLVPRVSYFPIVMEKVKRYIQSLVPSDQIEELWLDYQGISLKWHLPIGVLYDLVKRDSTLPWQITVHLKNFPESELVHLDSREAVESLFMQSIKEADQLKHRATVINAMQKRDHKQLWNALLNDRFDQFWSVNRRLMEEEIQHIPIRIYQEDKPFIQTLYKPVREGQTDETSDQRLLLSDIIPVDCLNPDIRSSSGVQSTVKASDHPSHQPPYRYMSFGIDIPLNTPLSWLGHNMAYPDNFVHIVIVENK